MELLNDDLKILRYIYSKRTVSFKRLKKHYKRNPDIPEIIRGMLLNDYICVVSGINRPTLASSIPDSCIFTLSAIGAAEVERCKWFNWEFIVKELLCPVIVSIATSIITAIITTIITLYLTGVTQP